MSLHLSTEEKIHLFRITLKGFNDYDPHLKHLLKLIRRFYQTVLLNQAQCTDIYLCIAQMELLIDELEGKIQKQRSFQEVIKQVDFYVN